MYKTELTEEEEPFQRIEIPGAGKATETGSPELPYIRQLIAIPECDDVVLTVNITGQTDFNNYNIYPAPGYEEVEEPGGAVYMQEVFYKDETVYAQDIYFTGMNAEIVSTGYLRDQKYAEVYIYPIQFNPLLKHIDVLTNYEVTLDFVNPTTPVNVNTGIFNNVATNTMLNYVSSGITASINDNVQGDGNVQWIELTETSQADNIVADYLIICAEPFFEPDNPDSEVLRIASHRATYNGFDVAILNANTVISDELDFFYEGSLIGDETYKKEQRIRTCIRRIYEGENALHTYDGKLGYVLLIGDSEYQTNLGMPSSYDHDLGIESPSDYYYSCLTFENGDYDPVGDLFIGRFSVDNNLGNGLTELHNMVSKTIYYESEATFGGWRNEICDLLHEELTGLEYTEPYFNFIDELIPNYFNANHIDTFLGNTHDAIYQTINSGVMMFIYCGHGGTTSWGVDGSLSMSVLENNLNNTNKAPVTFAFSCLTGYFDSNNDCFAEELTTYSETDGFTGYLGAAREIWFVCGIPIYDPPVEIQEYLPYSIFHNLSHVIGECVLETKTLGFLYAMMYNYFGDPALNLMAQGFQVTHDIELQETTTISTEITVKNGATLTVPLNGQIFFENSGSLTIEEGATLIISDNSIITALNYNELIIDGNITVGDNVKFISGSGSGLVVLLNSTSIQTTFNNTTFQQAGLTNYAQNLTISNSTFDDAGFNSYAQNLTISNSTFDDCFTIYSHTGVVNVTNTSFDRTWLYLENTEDNTNAATVSNCSFSTDYTMAAIDIWNYNQYDISNNTIDGYYNGIQIIQSGYGNLKKNMIRDNTITNCTRCGIIAYGTQGSVYRNHISNNMYGVWFADYSNMKLRGYSGAEIPSQTQEIRDNSSFEVYASKFSFPTYFRYNAIIDDDNTGAPADPLVYHSGGELNTKDVRNNCWEDNAGSFNPTQDLYPGIYIWQPMWCPTSSNSNAPNPDEDMYEVANNLFEAEDYTGAKEMYEMLIDQYPQSKFAKAAMQELFALEKFASNSYTGLKQYYENNTNPELSEIRDYLIAKCDIKLENWPDAISHYENIILNPETLEDSIFAIIDLGYVYFVMENSGYKTAYTGNLIQYKPESKEQFFDHRNYLLSLIPGDKMSETIKENIARLNAGELIQNIPNPFMESTQIWYKLESESIVQLNVYNYTGQLIKSYDEGTKTKGTHHINFDATGLKNGIYFYSINFNGQTTDSKKMTIMK